MNSADILVLEQVGVAQLAARADLWAEPVAPRQPGPAADPLGRLERLGLVVRKDTSERDGVALTRAGVEALAYLAS